MGIADRPQDLIKSLPGFPSVDSWGFKAYSGILEVPGPIVGDYDELRIHYQFHTSKRNPEKDPVVAWHQGGPGCSSITIGEYGEMGALIIGEDGNYVNPHAWNNFANMLYLESPAGSDDFLARGPNGYSECIKYGRATDCYFDDRTQAEAYAHTLTQFFKEFPEYAQHNFFLTGESYFGQFGPNIAHFLLNNEPFKTNVHLKGIAAGNACWVVRRIRSSAMVLMKIVFLQNSTLEKVCTPRNCTNKSRQHVGTGEIGQWTPVVGRC